MPEQQKIHPERLTTKATVFEGTLPVDHLPRLRDLVATPEGELHYRVAAGLDAQRRQVVSCIIEGFVFLTCQRSLEAFRHAISVDDHLVLVASEAELPPIEEEGDAEDHVVADAPLDVRSLVEDAVILALPMVPRKPGMDEDAGSREKPVPGTQSPFAALATLKRQK
jgi:uncharacterized protein